MRLVADMYDDLALMTGFPIYTNDTDKPDTDRFILHCLTQGLQNIIDNIYVANNITERNDVIVTTANTQTYGFDGLIKNIELIRSDGKVIQLRYADRFNKDASLDVEKEHSFGEPKEYVIKGGYLKLLPIPDKAYKLKLTISTKNLILANNDVYKTAFTDINDTLLADQDFADLVVLRAAVLVFARAQNPNAQIYGEICQKRLADYVERSNRTMEAQRGYERNAGHYRSDRGLLD